MTSKVLHYTKILNYIFIFLVLFFATTLFLAFLNFIAKRGAGSVSGKREEGSVEQRELSIINYRLSIINELNTSRLTLHASRFKT